VKFTGTAVQGAQIVEINRITDDRGFFARVGVTLDADEHTMLYIPEGCAHGYQTLTDDSEIAYFTTATYDRDAATGSRYNDPAFGIEWPLSVEVISGQDASSELWSRSDWRN
jgi:dTDP-4-dehydrorhamnose 3,5-epimerase